MSASFLLSKRDGLLNFRRQRSKEMADAAVPEGRFGTSGLVQAN